MLKADFVRLDNLPNAFSTKIAPPAILLDARYTSDGKDVRVSISQQVENGPWNVLEVESGNVNLRGVGVRPGDTIKCYLFPDSETRHRQRVTGDADAALVRQESTDLVVAQVLDDNRVQIVEGIVPPRDMEVRVPEDVYASQFRLDQAAMDLLRDQGKIDAFGVKLPAVMFPLDFLPSSVTGMDWPPRIEVWRVQDDRMKAINRALGGYAKRGEPALAWEPSPDAEELTRLVESFNRWLRSREAPARRDPPELLATLPDPLRQDARLQDYWGPESINRRTFAAHEGQLLQEAVWCRDIAGWAAGDSFDPLPRARRLFDWTVRNVTLTDSPRVVNHRPWHSLVYGRGTAAKRAWLFNLLCRQQRILGCVLTIPPEDGEGEPWLWCGIIDHGELYLFDPQLGLEIPAGEGVATLEAVREDDALLRQLDLPDAPYPVTAESVQGAQACIVSDSMLLAARSKELEEQQGGESALVLHQDVDALAAELQKTPGVASVALWEHPWTNLRRRLRLADASSALAERTRGAAAADFQHFSWVPRLWKARMLHFRGMIETEREAKKKGVLHDPINDHRKAAQLYLHRRVRPSEKVLAEEAPNPERLAIYRRSKVDATYWLGLLKYEQGSPRQTQNWLENKALAGDEADYRRAGVQYNLARALESSDQAQRAAQVLGDSQSPQQQGDRLRAARLAPSEETPAED